MPRFVVRYGSMRHLGVMSARVETLRRGDRVVVRTNRGVEIGDVLCEATDDALAHLDDPPQGTILRPFSEDDAAEAARIEGRRDGIFETCRTRIAESGLDMKLIDVETTFGGDRIVVYYLSENRVDFRDLVKTLAGELRTRIEMRQVGVRDEAKLLADYGDCGKPVCCNTHLSQMPPVSMKMAKLQKATLDPNKISGRCGRLKCCLRYEYDTYEALLRELPPVGSEIVTREGKGRVIGVELLAEQLLIEAEDMRRRSIHSSEILTVVRRGPDRSGRQGGGSGEKGGADRGDRPPRGPRTDAPRGDSKRGDSNRGDSSRGDSPRGEANRPPAGARRDAPGHDRSRPNRDDTARSSTQRESSSDDPSLGQASLDEPSADRASSDVANSASLPVEPSSARDRPRAERAVERNERSARPDVREDETSDADDLGDDAVGDETSGTEGDSEERSARRSRRRRGRRRRGSGSGEGTGSETPEGASEHGPSEDSASEPHRESPPSTDATRPSSDSPADQ